MERLLERERAQLLLWFVVAVGAGIAGWLNLPGPIAWTGLLIAAAGMLLPLTAYVWTATVQAQESSDAAPADGKNPRSEYWREVRESEPGYTAVRGQETAVLIQSRGQTWRELRNGPVTVLGAIMVVGMLVALAGRIARAFITETRGVFQPEWTVEQVAERWDEACDKNSLVTFPVMPQGFMDHLGFSFDMARGKV